MRAEQAQATDTQALYPPTDYPQRKRWSRAECQTLEATGLWDQERLELIEGELISRMSKKRPHVIVLMLVMEWLSGVFGNRHVNPEAPIDVSPQDNLTNEPEPDLVVLAKVATEYTNANPTASEVRLVVEISDTTLGFDLGTKARLYARAGISEYWVVDITGRRIIVHRNPGTGTYASVVACSEGESISPLAKPSSSFPVSSAFPARQI